MSRLTPSTPPRPLSPGDVVAAFSDALGEWTAAQITDLDASEKAAGVLELDWSGPEPVSVADLGDVTALRLTHHSWNGGLSHCNYEWILPRSYKVIGALPLLHTERSRSYSSGWWIGQGLARQRRWDAGESEPADPGVVDCTGAEINRVLEEQPEPRPDVRRLSVSEIDSLDCGRLAEHFPNLKDLSLSGNLGRLAQAASLNRLNALMHVDITDLFGMGKDDRLLPEHVPALEALWLHSIPAEYAAASRKTWTPEVRNGTSLVISAARKPEWVAENLTNPLRDWDGREHISAAAFKKAVALYKTTRQAVLATLTENPAPERLEQIGRDYGDALNQLDARFEFIETEEREELYAALDVMVDDAEAALGVDLSAARDCLASGVDDVRDW